MVEEKKEFKKREPAINVTVNEISKDIPRVAVLGTIVQKDDSIFSITIDDGTGKVTAILNDEESYKKTAEGQIVRVIGKVWGEKEEKEIQAEIVQDFSEINIDLYRKVILEQ